MTSTLAGRLHLSWWWLVLPLAGCLSPPLASPARPEPRAAAVVERHLVAFPAAGDKPDASAVARVDQALERLEGLRHIDVRVSAPGRGQPSAMVRRRIASVTALLRARHPALAVTTMITDGSGPADVVVDVRGIAVAVASCPDWSRDVAGDSANRPMSNLGCATAHNLGQMLDDPRELEHGAAFAGTDGAREAEAVARYRADKVKALQNELSQP